MFQAIFIYVNFIKLSFQFHRLPILLNFVFIDSFVILNTRAKKIIFFFSSLRLFHGLIVGVLKLPSKPVKMPSKMQIAVQKSCPNCHEGVGFSYRYIPASKNKRLASLLIFNSSQRLYVLTGGETSLAKGH